MKRDNIIIFKPVKKDRFYVNAGKYFIGPFPNPQQAIAAYKKYTALAA